jgi:GntR family transcriptional regulator, transcriptional repressor for pyruvate dehydrogenase complex
MAAKRSADTDPDDLIDWIILRFKQLIGDGTLRPGSKLPSERELSAHFGVSRTSLRPAMKVLKTMGVISQRVGDGTYFSGDASSVLAQPMEFLFLLDGTSSEELVQTRLIVEPTLAAKAAERVNPSQLLILRQTIAEIEAAGKDQFRIIEADLLFHRTILQISGNRILERLFQVIHRSMLNMMILTSQLVDRDHTLEFHQAILKAIERRDPADAERHMREHLIDARLLLQQAQQARADEQLRMSIRRHTPKKNALRDAVKTGRSTRQTGKVRIAK